MKVGDLYEWESERFGKKVKRCGEIVKITPSEIHVHRGGGWIAIIQIHPKIKRCKVSGRNLNVC